jgi:hypothetical protein
MGIDSVVGISYKLPPMIDNPSMNQRVLLIYDGLHTKPLQGWLGGYVLSSATRDVMFDFVRYEQKNFNTMVMVYDDVISFMSISRSLNLRVMDRGFMDQALHFTGSNDFSN